jgi:hypothetical protein
MIGVISLIWFALFFVAVVRERSASNRVSWYRTQLATNNAQYLQASAQLEGFKREAERARSAAESSRMLRDDYSRMANELRDENDGLRAALRDAGFEFEHRSTPAKFRVVKAKRVKKAPNGDTVAGRTYNARCTPLWR